MTAAADGVPVDGIAGARARMLVPVLVFVGLVVAVVGSLGAPLVPTVAHEFGVSLGAAQWSLTITLLAGAVVAPVLGRLGDGARRRPVLLTAVGAVVAGCALAAAPLGYVSLLTGRALQGVGLGLVPMALAIARDVLPPEQARSAIGVLSVTSAAGIGVAYPLAGLVTEAWGLPAAYMCGAVVSLLALGAAAWAVPPAGPRPRRPLDLPGALLLGVAVSGLLLVIGDAGAWPLGVVAVVALVWWVHHERRAAHPLVDLRLLARRSVLTADVTILVGGVGMYLLLSLVARYVQTPAAAGYGFDESVIVAGAVLVPFSVASFVAGRLAGPVTRRLRPERALAVGFAIVIVALGTFLTARDRLWEVLVTMAVAGLGVGLVFAANPTLLVAGVPPGETGSALAFNQVLRNLGFSMGSAVAGAVLAASTPAGRAVPVESGYRIAALVAVGMSAVAAVIALAIPRRAGDVASRS